MALAGVQDDAMTELFCPRCGKDSPGAPVKIAVVEARLARTWLARRDYVRAVIYAQEVVISGQCPRDRLNEFDARREAADTLRSERRVRLLFNIRNALAHGVLPISAEVVIRALSSERVMVKCSCSCSTNCYRAGSRALRAAPQACGRRPGGFRAGE